MNAASTYFQELNQDYLKAHRTKEDLFWDTYMAIRDDHAGFARAEQAFKAFKKRLKLTLLDDAFWGAVR
jgi:hypothetical protein